MQRPVFLLMSIFLSFGMNAQSLIGAWDYENENLKTVLIFSDKYFSSTTYNPNTGAFIATKGGSWNIDGNSVSETIEFDSKNPESVGSKSSYEISISDSTLQMTANNIKMKRIDDCSPGVLHGAWLMLGRSVDGKIQLRNSDTPRKTMKILSGTRFQWIAYNTETKQFMATGGGTYTTQDGIYTENIEFFSRDNDKVGLQLEFSYSLKNSDWHHFGTSTKGDPIDEVWSLRK